MPRQKTIAETLRDAAVVIANQDHRLGICEAIELADSTWLEWCRAKNYVQDAMEDCSIVTAYAYGERLRLNCGEGPLECNREARVLACLWLALEAEEEGI